MRFMRSVGLAAVAAGALAGGIAAAAPPGAPGGFTTTIKPYAKGVPGSGWETQPLFSVGDVVPETGVAGAQYRMVGIPDGLGVERLRGHGRGHGKGKPAASVRVLMTHEFRRPTSPSRASGAPPSAGPSPVRSC